MLSRFAALAVVLSMFGVLAAPGFAGVELVTNGGFETNSLSGWTQSGNPAYTTTVTAAHSGSYAAAFGPVSSQGYITQSQSLVTDSGAEYQLSFWLANNGGPTNEFTVWWDGGLLLDWWDLGPFDYWTFAGFRWSKWPVGGSI